MKSLDIKLFYLLESAKEKATNANSKSKIFSFRQFINEKFLKYKTNILFDKSDEEVKKIFGDIPINKESLLDNLLNNANE